MNHEGSSDLLFFDPIHTLNARHLAKVLGVMCDNCQE